MALVIGDCSAAHLRTFLGNDDDLSTAGLRGARLGDDGFRRCSLRQAQRERPLTVVILIGGTDLACPTFRQRTFTTSMRKLALGLLAAGAERIRILPIPPA